MMRFSTKNVAKTALVIVFIGLIASVVLFTLKIRDFDTDVPVGTITPEPVATRADSRLLIMGDVFWGRYIRDAAMKSEKKYAFPFSELKSFDKDKYDSWIANLECPVTNNSLTSAQQEATLTFNCRPEFLPEAAKWFDVVSLANNHTDNMGGQSGLDITRANLSESNIQYYGHYDNAMKDDICEIVSVPMHVIFSSGLSRVKSWPIAMCGYHGVFKVPLSDELDVIKEYSKYFLTIVTPHMGTEYEPAADELKTSIYRSMIDKGADAVVGGHPHWVQNTESYKGKLILYSLGNFIFDQQDSLEVRRSAMLDITFSIDSSPMLKEWLGAKLQCEEPDDNCLLEAKRLHLEKPDFSLTYDIESSLNTGYVTGRAPETVHTQVLDRLNWKETVEQLVN